MSVILIVEDDDNLGVPREDRKAFGNNQSDFRRESCDFSQYG